MAPYDAGAIAGMVLVALVVIDAIQISLNLNSTVVYMLDPFFILCPCRHRNGKKSKKIRQRKKESRAEERTDRL